MNAFTKAGSYHPWQSPGIPGQPVDMFRRSLRQSSTCTASSRIVCLDGKKVFRRALLTLRD